MPKPLPLNGHSSMYHTEIIFVKKLLSTFYRMPDNLRDTAMSKILIFIICAMFSFIKTYNQE
mgnify:FL=1